MNFNPLITVLIGISFFMWVSTQFFRPDIPKENLRSSQIAVAGEEGLDLKALLAVVREAKDAADLEAKINTPGGINNLDLNQDGQVDFIRVNEFGDRSSGKYGFSFTVEPEADKVQEVATVEITPQGKEVEVSAYGNEGVYGSRLGYTGLFPASSFFLMGYLLSSAIPYSSPYGYSRYPSYYSPFSATSGSDYFNRSSKFRSSYSGTASSRGPSMNSPFSSKQSFRRGLRNSTGFQKGFGRRQGSVGSGGFGRKGLGINPGRRNPFGSFGSFGSGRSGFGQKGLGGFSSRRSLNGLRGLRGFGGFRGFRGFRR